MISFDPNLNCLDPNEASNMIPIYIRLKYSLFALIMLINLMELYTHVIKLE